MYQYVAQYIQTTPGLSEVESTYRYWVDSLYNCPLDDQQYVIDKVRDWCKVQEYKLAIMQGARIIQSGGDPSEIDTLIENIGTKLSLSHGDLGLDPTVMDDHTLMNTLFSRPARNCIGTNWPHLNQIVGGPGKKELFCVIAPTGTGKSWTLANIGVAAAQRGKFVVHITLEMSEVLTLYRYYSILTGVSHSELRSNMDAVSNVNRTLRDNGGTFLIKEYPSSTARVSDIRDYLTRVESAHQRKIDMVIIDYADLLEGRTRSRGGGDDNVVRHILTSIYTDLRAIAVQRDLAMVTASQTNRSSVNKEIVTIGDLAEAFSKAHIADIMIALCQTQEEYDACVMRFFVAKNRNDRMGAEIRLRLDYARGRMDEGTNLPQSGGGAAAALASIGGSLGDLGGMPTNYGTAS